MTDECDHKWVWDHNFEGRERWWICEKCGAMKMTEIRSTESLKVPVKTCPTCGADLDVKTYRPTMCGSPHGYYYLYYYCPMFDCEEGMKKVEVSIG